MLVLVPDYLKDCTKATFADLTNDLVFESWVLFLDCASIPDYILELREWA